MDYYDTYDPAGGAWYNNWGDFKGAVSSQFTDPNSYLRSGRLGNAAESIVNPLTDAIAGFAPEYTGVATGIQRGFRQFRDLTGLGLSGGAKGDRVRLMAEGIDANEAARRRRELATEERDRRRRDRERAARGADALMGGPAAAAAGDVYPPNIGAPPVSL